MKSIRESKRVTEEEKPGADVHDMHGNMEIREDKRGRDVRLASVCACACVRVCMCVSINMYVCVSKGEADNLCRRTPLGTTRGSRERSRETRSVGRSVLVGQDAGIRIRESKGGRGRKRSQKSGGLIAGRKGTDGQRQKKKNKG